LIFNKEKEMKKYLSKSFAVVIALTLFSLNGCILDSFNSFTQNVPITEKFVINNNLTSTTLTQEVSLDSSSIYQNYQDKIESIKLLRAEYRTVSVTPSDLSGNIEFTLADNNHNTLFYISLGKLTPANFQKTPLEFTLTGSQIEKVNSYLSMLSNKTFFATISVTNIQSSSPNYELVGAVDVLFEMETKL
jgi:hypothetical protein